MTDFETELNKEGFIVYANKGVSMMPLIRQGKDAMVIEKKNTDFKKNDAVLFKRDNGQYVLHRINKIIDGGYYIIGDNCVSGEFVRNDQMLGILTALIRNKKKISITDTKYKLYVFIVPVLRAKVKLKYFIKKIIISSARKLLGKNYETVKNKIKGQNKKDAE